MAFNSSFFNALRDASVQSSLTASSWDAACVTGGECRSNGASCPRLSVFEVSIHCIVSTDYLLVRDCLLPGCWMLVWVMQKAIGEYPCVSLRRENIVWYYCLSTVSCMCWCEEENHPCDLSTNYRLSVDQLSTNYRPSILVAIDQLSTKCRPTIDPNWDIHT